MSTPATSRLYEFGPFLLDEKEHKLLRDGHPLPLTPKAVETLLVLVENSGHVVDKRELMDRVWPETFVEEGTLVQNIFTLRKALGENAGGKSYIETVPRRGYCFAADVQERRGCATVFLHEHSRTEITIQEEQEVAAASSIGKRTVTRLRRPALYIALASVLLAAATVVLIWVNRSSAPVGSGARLKSLAVLPFKTIGSTEVEEYLGLGMADALITRLGGTKQIAVRPTNSVRRYETSGLDPLAAGRELGVDAVLDGNIQKSRDRLRVTVQLFSTKDGAPLWTKTYDETLRDIFALQDSISSQVVRAVGVTLTAQEKQVVMKHHTESSEAYQAYLKGRYFWGKRRGPYTEKAKEYFQQAIDIDPGYALAYAGLAEVSVGAWTIRSFEDAVSLSTKAVELDPSLPDAHTSLGVALLHLSDWKRAESSLKRAIELNPDDANAHLWQAIYLRAMGRLDEAIAESERSVELDPLSVVNNLSHGVNLYFVRRYDEAVRQYQKTLELDPEDYWARLRLAEVHTMMRRYDEAFAEYSKAPRGSSSYRRGYTCAASGKLTEARRMIAASNGAPSYDIALIQIALGEIDAAFDTLDGVLKTRDPNLSLNIKADPKVDPIRSDPRFATLIRGVGLEQ
jgi:DNA-binding winged helix-turn-helix (wHTH) protein/TolB-like protein/tetratricopeptide (TPR) repeat protein